MKRERKALKNDGEEDAYQMDFYSNSGCLWANYYDSIKER